MSRVPKRLKKEPLIEAIWQVLFESPNAGEALPGLLYSRLRQDYPSVQLHRLPTAEIPAAVAENDPNLRFAVKVRLEPPEAPYVWQVGDRVATLNCRKPYVGWQQFKTAILDLVQIMEQSDLVPRPERHSLRYIDFLTLDKPPDLSALQIEMRLGTRPVIKLPLNVRLELPDGDFHHVVQIVTPAEVRLRTESRDGSVVDLETYLTKAPESWEQVREQLEALHDQSKKLFFTQLLTPDAIQALDPEY